MMRVTGRQSKPLLALAACALAAGIALAACSPSDTGGASGDVESGPRLEVVVPGSAFHGVHGLTVAPDGSLLAGSVVGQAIYRVDPDSGAVNEWIGPPEGMADDLEFGPGEQLVWTSIISGLVRTRGADGELRVLAEGYPGANAVAFDATGRLFMSQVFQGDALWELDPRGERPPRRILDAPGGLNGFDFGSDGKLYGPLWFRHQVVRVDVDSSEMTVVADGFGTPAAANFDSKGRLHVLDTERGEVVRVDTESGEKTVVAQLKPSLDNLAFSADDRLFVSNMADNAILEVDLESGKARTLVEGKLAMPGGIGLWEDEGRVTLYVADTFAYRTVDASSGEVTTVRRMHAQSTEELDYPFSASATADQVLLTSWFSGTVQRVDRRSGESLEMLHGFAGPVAAVALEDGRLVVAELGSGSLVVVSGAHGETRDTVLGELGGPVALIAAGGTKVFVTESAGTLSEVDIATGAKRVIASGLVAPEGLAQLADGGIVVAEVGLQRLVRIDPTDGSVEVLIPGLPIGLPPPPGVPPAYVPTGVAVSADGTVYFTSDLENAIYRLRVL